MKSKQGDITAAFIHAKLEGNENVFVKMPKGFGKYEKHGKRRVIRLKNTLYGLCHSPRDFWKYSTHKSIASGVLQYNLYPYLFIGDKVICIYYTDDLIFWAKDESDIHDLSMKLCDMELV